MPEARCHVEACERTEEKFTEFFPKDLRKHRIRVFGKVGDMRTSEKASRKSFSGPARKRLLSPNNFNNTADKKVEFNFFA